MRSKVSKAIARGPSYQPLSARLRGEREGPVAQQREGEVGGGCERGRAAEAHLTLPSLLRWARGALPRVIHPRQDRVRRDLLFLAALPLLHLDHALRDAAR